MSARDVSRGFFKVEDVLRAANGRWEHVLAAFEVRTELLRPKHGPCPGCGGNDRFRFDDKNGEGTFICSQGGAGVLSGNGLQLLQHCTGWDFKRAVEELGRYLLRDEDRVVWGGSALGAVSRESLPREELPPEPKAPDATIPKYDEEKLKEYTKSLPALTREDLKKVSPVKVEKAVPGDFFEVLYAHGERQLVFTNFYSQGDFLYQCGAGSCRLSQDRGVKAVVSPLPTTGRNGVWFLCNPVNGKWEKNPGRVFFKGPPKGCEGPAERLEEPPEWKRRNWRNVTSYRYAVLESDSAPEHLWLKALVKLPLPIVAIYSSGGKSLHALVRVDAGDKLTWDRVVCGRNDKSRERTASIMSLVCPLGADPAALSAVRLTRMPFCMREGVTTKTGYQRYDQPRLQELIYLNPVALDKPPEWRSLESRHGGGRR
jgi:hypothetical protein